ncbi:low-specificity L-threonine aldolase [Pleionea sp. CnH1-48]|uniref:low-specificity L-threonine aldolase n=1 Tax=Pleionea sp. CnH1-48 TaxID=2954494 RepID=UPI0020973BDD|nr:low-specificity L-threonine aldolase [Pleionea sp. CnH1-48]MCO7224120.1 low-specificity L-threonine aldolase [Pleionea sp. CnH1-48]
MSHLIDLRSDTVTLPSAAMKDAMHTAPVGDDVYGEDPTINQLEEYCAELLGKEAALFASSGTQTNLLALLTHCQRGEEYIVGQHAHTYKYEAGGAAVLGSIQPQPIHFNDDGYMPLDDIKAVIKPDDLHFAKSKLVCLENTHAGQCLPQDYPAQVKAICEEHNLLLHLDGARIFNAVVAQNTHVRDLTKDYDSVSICLSKGLGAPVGSVLVGSAEFIKNTRRWRKMLGGGMRQAGMLAAACLYALQNNVERLQDDHDNASLLLKGLQEIDAVECLPHSAQTNMVFVKTPQQKLDKLIEEANKAHIILPKGQTMRLVTHLNMQANDIIKVIDVFKKVLG